MTSERVDAQRRLANRLLELWPDRPPPIGIARVESVPARVPVRSGTAAAACQFWREGTQGVFAAGENHGLCPIGRLTQGFSNGIPPTDETVAAMVEVGYIDPAELPSLLTLGRGHAAIVYGPLADLPIGCEAVLVLATPAQAMLLDEMLGLARLDAPGLRVMGRPTCAAVSASIQRGEIRASFACTGARLHAGMDEGEMLLVLPAAMLDELAGEIERIVDANRAVAAIGEATRARVSARF